MPSITSVEQKVLGILEKNPAVSYSIIAGEIGVTRERVRQIARQNGYPPRKRMSNPKVCPTCGRTFYSTENIYCSPDCGYRAKRKRIVVICYQCGKPIERTPGTMRSKSGNYFCNRACYAKRTAKNHTTES